GEWHHLAGVVDRTNNEARLYLNGELVATQSIANLGGFNSDDNLIIGSWDVNSNQDYWHGQIDEVRIWNTALTEDEIQDNLDKKLDGTENGLVAYYTFEDGTADDQTNNGNNGSFNGNATTTVDNDVPVNDLTDSLASDPFATNGATYGIETSQSAEITIQDSDAYATEIIIADEYGDEVSNTNLVVVDESGDAKFKIKLGSQPTSDVTINLSTSQGSLNQSSFTFNDSNWDTYEEVTVSGLSSSFNDFNVTATLSGNDTNYSGSQSITITDSSDNIKLKVTEGGAELELNPTVSITATNDATEGNETESGVFTISLDTPAPEGGLLIPISVSSTATEGTDYSFYADSFTYNVESALSFDGVDDYVELPSVIDPGSANAFTAELWFKLDTTVNSNEVLLRQQDGNGSGLAWLSYQSSSGKLRSSIGGSNLLSENTVTTGVWHHAAVVYDGATLYLYLDGNQEASDVRTLESSDGELILGNIKALTNSLDGQIDEVRIWETAKTEEEIQDSLYTKLAGTEDGLVAYYNFDSDVDTTINDSTNNGFDGTLVNGDSSNLTTSNIGYTLTDWEVTKTPVVKIAEGETEATITVSKIDNETVEAADETVTVTLEDWANYEVDNNNQSATVTLNDDDEVGIEFAKLDTLGSIDNIAQEFIVSTAFNADSGTVGITLNNGDSSYTFAAGTELTFDGGAIVTVDSSTT
ncbi:MAG: LamG domain-containing protein, partial [Cyanobacteria bacterium J06649_11]